MRKEEYAKHIKERLGAEPRLMPCLMKVLSACEEKIPGQITLCSIDDIELFSLVCLFHNNALKVRNGKIVLYPEKMVEAGIDFKLWLDAASAWLDSGTCRKRSIEESPEQLIAKLEMLYPAFGNSLQMLRRKISSVKKKITELGGIAAFEYYRLALDAATCLKDADTIISPAEFGVKLTGDSKRFKVGSAAWNLTAALLAEELGLPEEKIMASCGIQENPTASTVTVFGPFICYRGEEKLDWISRLWHVGEAAILHAGNLEHLTRIEIQGAALPELITCENESPFNYLQRTSDLPPLVYTGGFPNSSVKRFLSLLPEQTKILHWGDTDPEGLAIAGMLNRIRPVKLFRCTIDECTKLKSALRPLDDRKRKRAENMLNDPNFPFRAELKFSLEYGWLEQEAWTPF